MDTSLIVKDHQFYYSIILLFSLNQLFLLILNVVMRILIIYQSALLNVTLIILLNHSVERFIPLLFSSNLLFPLHLSEFI